MDILCQTDGEAQSRKPTVFLQLYLKSHPVMFNELVQRVIEPGPFEMHSVHSERIRNVLPFRFSLE